jgi:SAM-dependent methyltransferase
MSAILRLFDGLNRCAPGDLAAVAIATAGLAPDAVVLDAGCGRGADLPALLAAVPQGRIVAVDNAAPFIDHVGAHFPRVQAHVADMLDPPGAPFDLIWSGGAAYGPGVSVCLAAWRKRLAPGGRVAFTDLCWRVARPSRAAQAFWAAEYPAMTDAAGLDATIRAEGLRVVASAWLSDAAWAAYYDPVLARMATLEDDSDPQMQAVLSAFRAEIALWRDHGADYGYRLNLVECQ